MTAQARLLPFESVESDGLNLGTKRRQFNGKRWEQIFFALFAVLCAVLTTVNVVATVSTFGSWREVNNIKMDIIGTKEDIANKHVAIQELLDDVQKMKEDIQQLQAQQRVIAMEEDVDSVKTDARNLDEEYAKAERAELGLTDGYYEAVMGEFIDDDDGEDDNDDDDFVDYVYDDDVDGDDGAAENDRDFVAVPAAADDGVSGDVGNDDGGDDFEDADVDTDQYVGSGEENDDWNDDKDYYGDDEEEEDYNSDEINSNEVENAPGGEKSGARRQRRSAKVDCKAVKESKCNKLEGTSKKQCKKDKKACKRNSKKASKTKTVAEEKSMELKSAHYMATDIMPNIQYEDTTFEGNHALKIFKESSFNSESGADSLARLSDNSKLEIKQNGIYLVYVQALMEGNTSTMGVSVVHTNNKGTVKGLATCVNGVHPDHTGSLSTQQQSCFVQRLFHLQKGDVLTVNGDSKVVIDGKDTYFGMIQMKHL